MGQKGEGPKKTPAKSPGLKSERPSTQKIEEGLQAVQKGENLSQSEIQSILNSDPYESLKAIIKDQRLLELQKIGKYDKKKLQKQLYISEMKSLQLSIENFKLRKAVQQVHQSQVEEQEIKSERKGKQDDGMLEKMEGLMGQLRDMVGQLEES